MKNNILKGIGCAVFGLCFGINMLTASADSVRTVTIGADLSEAQKEKIFEFFNTDETKANVIEITNQDERKYLEGVVADSIIGTHTYSCAYIEPTTEGGIFVKTANLNWVTAEMLGNALITAGIDNCNVLATAPFEVSGTGALTGVMKAYEVSTDTELDEDKKQLASEELVLTAELTDDDKNNQEDVLQAVNDIKQEVLDEKNPDDEKINDIVINVTNDYNLNLTDEQLDKLNEMVKKFTELDYDKEDFKNSLDDFKDKLTNTAENLPTEEAKNWFQKIWEAIVNFFKNLFSSGSEKVNEAAGELSDSAESFFGNINTDVFEFDDETSSENDTAETEAETNAENNEETAIIEVTEENSEDSIAEDNEPQESFETEAE